ncbi:MAG: Acg family FMN-binding oxidoreductase [Alcanivoracaceae bacterium]
MQQPRSLIPYAVMAPSGHNTQPWRFEVSAQRIDIFPDFSRRLPVVDADDHALFISLGCALENLLIAAAQSGVHTRVEYFPAGEQCLRVHLEGPGDIANESTRILFDAMPRRQSNRGRYEQRPLSEQHITALALAARQPDVRIELISDIKQRQQMAQHAARACEQQFSDPAFVRELQHWIRFSQRERNLQRDGLAADTMGMPFVPRWFGRLIMALTSTPQREARKVQRQAECAPLLALFCVRRNDASSWVNAGRSYQRLALTATALGIAHAHLNMPCEVINERAAMKKSLGLEDEPVLLIRLGFGKRMPMSVRRPANEVMVEHG